MADGKYQSTLSGPELDAALRAAVTVKEKVRSELQYAKDSGEFDGPQGIQGIQGPMGVLGQAGQIQDFESAAAVAGPSFNYYANFSTPLIEGVNGSKICGVTTLPANLWRYQLFLLGYSDLPTILMRRLEEDNTPEELEWVNPPMELGVEYRTNRRHNGKAVYTKRISVTLPNSSQIGVGIHSTPGNTFKLVSAEGTIYGFHEITSSGGVPQGVIGEVPISRYADKLLICSSSLGTLDIATNSNLSELTADITLEYTID